MKLFNRVSYALSYSRLVVGINRRIMVDVRDSSGGICSIWRDDRGRIVCSPAQGDRAGGLSAVLRFEVQASRIEADLPFTSLKLAEHKG
ncbi:MAG: hypothetical protein ABIN58_06325 [candidate division WOR-3 bacterium]